MAAAKELVKSRLEKLKRDALDTSLPEALRIEAQDELARLRGVKAQQNKRYKGGPKFKELKAKKRGGVAEQREEPQYQGQQED